MKTVMIGQDRVPQVGQGTWQLGRDRKTRDQEIEALRYGIERGLTLIDTAEMYADGGAEEVVGEAIRQASQPVFVVSKVWPSNQAPARLRRSLEASLKRLGREQLDLYLLHWPSRTVPLKDALAGLVEAYRAGLTRYVGVSNFPTAALQEALALMPPDVPLVVDQVEYHLANRRAETQLLPFARAHQVTLMAYSPVKFLAHLRPGDDRADLLARLAQAHHTAPATIALAYLLEAGPVIAIPKALSRAHIDANAAALEITLTEEERRALQEHFPCPSEDLPFTAL
ncbi:MAG: aldo/keto reductase [Firmicutes bacterium]|nr:aldo/keto reductase [Bacillota bacterium]